MQPLSLWLRWGVPQDTPSLTITSGTSDNTPDFILNGDLAVNDTVRFQYSTDSGFSGASAITNTIDAAEDAANALSFATGTLANGTWYFRARIERPPRGVTAWSNSQTITLFVPSPGGPISLFGRWFGGFGAPPLNVGGYISLFGRHFGGFGSTTAVVTPRGVGRSSGQRIKRSELDRRLKEQRDNTFGRRWFDEFLAAKEAAKEAAAEADNKARRKALAKAAKAAEQVREEVELAGTVPDLEPLTLALDAAASATRVKDALLSAKLAVDLANAMVAAMRHVAEQQDEDEALTLLLLQ